MGLIDQLKTAREQAGLSQSALAKRMDITRSYVTRIEGGHNNPSVDVVDQWLAACSARLVVAAVDQASEEDIAALQPRLRGLVLRLAWVIPHLPEALHEDLENRFRWWENRYLTKDASAHDSQDADSASSVPTSS